MKHPRATFLILSSILTASILLPTPGPDHRILHLPPVCPFYQLTGFPCPGCGLTRAFVCLGHGQLAASLHWHPIGWLVYALFVLLWVQAGLSWAYRRPIVPLSSHAQRLLSWGSLAGLLLVGLGRIAWLITHHLSYT